jgi:hypothetical protein
MYRDGPVNKQRAFKNKEIVGETRSGAMGFHGSEASQWKKDGESGEAMERHQQKE